MIGFLKKKLRPDPKAALVEVLGDASVPTIPAVVMSALEALRDPRSSIDVVIDKLAADPGLVLLLLKTVNSAAYGLRRPVDNLRHAVVMLGRTQVESLVLSVAVKAALPSRPAPGFDSARFWRTAAMRAGTAGALAQLLDPRSRNVAFTAGLLQDMALPLLASARTESYCPVLERWGGGEGSLDDLENAAFGWDHSDVAGWLCAVWAFPDGLARAIGAHHKKGHAPVAVVLVGLLPEDPQGADHDRLVEIARDEFGMAPDAVVDALATGAAHSEELGRLLAA